MIVNFNNRLNQAEEITCELEDRSLAIIQRRKKKLEWRGVQKACLNNGTPLSEIVSIVESQKEKREKGTENLFEETMTKNLPNLRDIAI